ncbi:MAG TPA: hypothetical protein VGE16_18265 [Albitalea sp.]
MSTTVSLPSSIRTSAPRLALPIGRLFAAVIAKLSDWMRPREESPIEAAARLRSLADQYIAEPSFAADLRAAADRHEHKHGIY